MRLLHWSRKTGHVRDGIVFPREIDGWGGEKLFENVEPLLKAGDTRTGAVKRDPELLKIGCANAGAKPTFNTAI
jgi:hypothetical protein